MEAGEVVRPASAHSDLSFFGETKIQCRTDVTLHGSRGFSVTLVRDCGAYVGVSTEQAASSQAPDLGAVNRDSLPAC